MPVSPLRYFPRLPYLPCHPRHFFAFFVRQKRGGVGRRRQQTCLIVEQGHKLLKGPIVRSNRVWFGHTFKKFYIDRQTRVFYFFGIPSVSTITMSYNWTWSTRSIFLASKKRFFSMTPRCWPSSPSSDGKRSNWCALKHIIIIIIIILIFVRFFFVVSNLINLNMSSTGPGSLPTLWSGSVK